MAAQHYLDDWENRWPEIDSFFGGLRHPTDLINIDCGVILGENGMPRLVCLFKGQGVGSRLYSNIDPNPGTNIYHQETMRCLGKLPTELFDKFEESAYVGIVGCSTYRIDLDYNMNLQLETALLPANRQSVTILSGTTQFLQLPIGPNNYRIQRLQKQESWMDHRPEHPLCPIVSELIEGKIILRPREWNLSYDGQLCDGDSFPFQVWYHPARIGALESAHSVLEQEDQFFLNQLPAGDLHGNLRGSIRDLRHDVRRHITATLNLYDGTVQHEELRTLYDTIESQANELKYYEEKLQDNLVRRPTNRRVGRWRAQLQWLRGDANQHVKQQLSRHFDRDFAIREANELEQKCHRIINDVVQLVIPNLEQMLEDFDNTRAQIDYARNAIINKLAPNATWRACKVRLNHLIDTKKDYFPNSYLSDTWQIRMSLANDRVKRLAEGSITEFGINDQVRIKDNVHIPGASRFSSYVKLYEYSPFVRILYRIFTYMNFGILPCFCVFSVTTVLILSYFLR